MLDLSNCRCIIFDLDGTILDSTQVWAKVDMDFLGRRGIPVSKEYMQEIKTHTFESGSVYTKEKYNLPESTEEIMKEWYDAACKAYTDKVVLKPYAKTFIEQMHNNGLKIVSATSSDRALFEPCLRRNGIYGFFDAFTQTNEVPRGKKFPDVYMKAAGKAGCSVNECILYILIILRQQMRELWQQLRSILHIFMLRLKAAMCLHASSILKRAVM